MKGIEFIAAGENSADAQRWMPRITAMILVLVAVPLLLSPYSFWDGILMRHALETRDNHTILVWFTTSGWHIEYFLFTVVQTIANATGLSGIMLLHLITVGSIVGTAYETVRFGERAVKLPRFWALAMGAAVAAFPTLSILLSEVMFMHILATWLVLLAVRLISSGTPKGYLVGLPLLLVSLQLNSNFMISIALAGAYAASYWVANWRITRAQIVPFVVVTATSVIAFALLKLLYKPSGLYVGYNGFSSSILNIKILIGEILRYGQYALLVGGVLIVAFALCEGLARLGAASRSEPAGEAMDRLEQARRLLWPVALGLALIYAAALPYIAVGKPADLRLAALWDLRQTLPMGPPLALFLVATARLLAYWPGLRRSALWFVPMAAVLLVLVTFQQALIWGKLERAAYQEGMVQAMKDSPPPAPGMVDYDIPNLPAPSLSLYETNWMLYHAHGREDWLSRQFDPPSFVDPPEWLAKPDADFEANKKLYVMRDFKDGCLTTLRFSGPRYSFWQTAYWMLGGSLPKTITLEQVGQQCPAQRKAMAAP